MKAAPSAEPEKAAAAAEAVRDAEREARLANLPEVADPYLGTTLGERYKVLSKLGAGNRTEAVTIAARQGLIKR